MEIKKDRIFWKLIKNSKLKVRFVRGTAIVIWTRGGFIPGNFVDRTYYIEVHKKDLNSLKKILQKNKIAYSKLGEEKKERPLIYIIPKEKFKVAKKDDLPVIPLKEFVKWCKKLYLDNVLEQLDLLYNLKLGVKYAEVRTNM